MASQKPRTPTSRSERLRLRQPTANAAAAPSNRRKGWRVPLGWLRDESFYRDITKSVLSTGTVALIAYLYALDAGYVSTPSGAQTFRGVLNVVATVGGLILFTSAFWWAFFFNPKSEKHRNKPRWERVVRWILFALMMAFICLLQFDVMARPLPFWPFNTEPFTLHFKDGRTF